MEPLDQFMLLRTAELARELREWYEQMLFHRIYQRLIQFCVVDLSALYMAVLKDRLYTFPRSSRERRSAQTAMWRIAEALARLVAPIMTFTADEVWRFLPALKSRPESAHMALFPNDHDITGEIRDREAAANLRADWEKLVAIRDEVNKAIEQARNEQGHQQRTGSRNCDHRARRILQTAGALSRPLECPVCRLSVELKLEHRQTERSPWKPAARRAEVRALLELLDARRRGSIVSDGLRTLLRRAESHRERAGQENAGAAS